MSTLGGIEILKKQTEKFEKILKGKDEIKIIEKQRKWEKLIQQDIENVERAIKTIQNQSIQN